MVVNFYEVTDYVQICGCADVQIDFMMTWGMCECADMQMCKWFYMTEQCALFHERVTQMKHLKHFFNLIG